MKAGGREGRRKGWERAQAGPQDGGQRCGERGSAQHPAGMQALDGRPGFSPRRLRATVSAKSQRDEEWGTTSPR